jgi:hypothetical protein
VVVGGVDPLGGSNGLPSLVEPVLASQQERETVPEERCSRVPFDGCAEEGRLVDPVRVPLPGGHGPRRCHRYEQDGHGCPSPHNAVPGGAGC